MNYYELNNFNPISIDELIFEFRNSETIINGNIAVFGDSIGQAGDRYIKLKNLLKKEDSVLFIFENNETVEIKKPKHIVVNKKVIGIKICEKVRWQTNELLLKYEVLNDKIVNRYLNDNYFVQINLNSYAFLFFVW
jgi:hypothetical protein